MRILNNMTVFHKPVTARGKENREMYNFIIRMISLVESGYHFTIGGKTQPRIHRVTEHSLIKQLIQLRPEHAWEIEYHYI